jgi:hypothetical protein
LLTAGFSGIAPERGTSGAFERRMQLEFRVGQHGFDQGMAHTASTTDDNDVQHPSPIYPEGGQGVRH